MRLLPEPKLGIGAGVKVGCAEAGGVVGITISLGEFPVEGRDGAAVDDWPKLEGGGMSELPPVLSGAVGALGGMLAGARFGELLG